MNRFEKRKAAIEKAMLDHVEAYKAVYKKADEEDRDPTDEERLEIESHLKAIETLKDEKGGVEENLKTLQQVDDIGRDLGPALPPSVTSEPYDRMLNTAVQSLGEAFTNSPGYQTAVKDIQSGVRQRFSTGSVSLEGKGTLLEGSSAPGSGSGGGLIAAPQVIPGVVNKLFQPLRIADLLSSGQTSTSTLRYMVEGTATSGAAGVAEGGAKPQSILGIGTVDEPVKKIATTLKVSDEMLEDAPAVQSYINARLSLFVQNEEERQLLSGAGTNELVGLFARSGNQAINIYAGGTAAGNFADQLFKAINGQRGSALLEPDFLVISPADYQTLRLSKDSANQYFGGGPFVGPYGGPQGPVPTSGQITGALDYVWMKPTVVTGALGAGTALVGTSTAAQVMRRTGVSVEATNSNEDDFTHNLVALRAEERLALCLYRPSAFTKVLLA